MAARMRSLRWGLPLLLAVPAGVWALRASGPEPLPRDLHGRIVFVSDKDGIDAIYLRDFATGDEHRLTRLSDPISDLALSPDGRYVAFSTRDRIGTVSVATGAVKILTLGIDWLDAAPSWRADARALVVSARRPGALNADVHVLVLDPDGGDPVRRPLTDTPGLDESQPVFTPKGDAVVCVREDNLVRVDLAGERARRLTGGFKRVHGPRFLPSGRLAFLWSEGKQYGIDVIDGDGKSRETLWQGPVYYRTLAPSPDGRFFVATYTFDLAFHPSRALRLRQTEEVRLLDAAGNAVGVVSGSWRHTSHSPDWGG